MSAVVCVIALTLSSTTTLATADGFALPARNTPATLRAAIADLTETFGERYPDGPAYLARLKKIEPGLAGDDPDAAQAAFEALQREALVANPLIAGQPWLIEVREQYWGNHGAMGTMFQTGDEIGRGCAGLKAWRGDGGRLDVIRFAPDGSVGSTRTLAAAPEGVLRDPDLSFDGKRVLFSMRRNREDDYHLYEVDVDGAGDLRQLTFGSMLSDVDPIYLPDGKILFSSTRDMKYCQCNRHIQPNLFVMEADGANVLQISQNPLSDFHSSLMADGRVLYSRWEYVDRHFGPSLGLWTTNPDGTNHQLFMGNNAWSPGFMGDARQIPGTNKVVCIYGACHDLPWGAMVIADRSKGLDGTAPIERIWPAEAIQVIRPTGDPINALIGGHPSIDSLRNHARMFWKVKDKFEDPWPVHDPATNAGAGKYFMVSRSIGEVRCRYGSLDGQVNMGVFLVDVFGNEVLVHSLPGRRENCFNPMPVAARPKPPAIGPRVDLTKNTGVMYVNDVYLGTGDEMKDVEPGAIKYLRIVEAPAKRYYDERGVWNIDAAQYAPMNWNLTNNKRILGDVPVEADGSAHFELPADTFVYFQALDAEKRMIQSMRSGTMVRPGETQGCTGCHEDRMAPPPLTNRTPLAMRRPPSRIRPWHNARTVAESPNFNYLTEVQPVFDKHCVRCHDYGKDAEALAKVNLAGDSATVFNTSYLSLMTRSSRRWIGPEMKLVNVVCDGPPAVLPAYSWGSTRSTLVETLRKGHHDVKLTKEEFARIVTWIDLNGVYYGNYSSAHPGRNPIPEDLMAELKELTGLSNIRTYTNRILTGGALVCFERPELSPILDHLVDEADRPRALEIIRRGAERLEIQPREDRLGRKAVAVYEQDVFRAKRRERDLLELQKSVDAHIAGEKHYPHR